jgi:wobble nucleotide-excising tRNase
VYFYRQVSHCKHKEKISSNDLSYWVVRKNRTGSRIQKYDKSPIKSSYQLLWDEYKHVSSNAHILPNVMRRILESYFSLLGDVPLDSVSDIFEGHNKQICESLLSWVHAGSHNVFDDAYYDITDETVLIYKEVFKEIFLKTGHEAHYEMMMGL